MTEAITLSESNRLIALEATIEAGRRTFVEVGLALAGIRDSRLYRADYKTFEDYCREKWGWTRMRTSQLIEAAGIKESLPKSVNNCLQNEGQARELAKVEAEDRAQVLETAKARADEEDRPMTARDIKEAATPNTLDEKWRAAAGSPEKWKPDSAIQFAKMAILQLERIDPSDTKRQEAFDLVIDWIRKQPKCKSHKKKK